MLVLKFYDTKSLPMSDSKDIFSYYIQRQFEEQVLKN